MIFSKNMRDGDIIKSRKFIQEVQDLAKKYNLPFFIVTNGASGYSNNGNPAIKNARNSHMEWEKKNGFDPSHDWSDDITKK